MGRIRELVGWGGWDIGYFDGKVGWIGWRWLGIGMELSVSG